MSTKTIDRTAAAAATRAIAPPSRAVSGDGGSPALFGGTIFLGAFLVFLVQPLIGRYILPWFGGSAGVWTVAMVFFQSALLAGYGYAHFIVGRFRLRTQTLVHTGVVLLGLLWLPIIPGDRLVGDGATDPTFGILVLLTVTVGLPYVVLATTGPLLQAWFARSHGGRNPYRFYALSNLGSLLALLSYPFVFERVFPRRAQAWAWSIGYTAFAVLAVIVAGKVRRSPASTTGAPAPDLPGADGASPASPHRAVVAPWIVLPALASTLFIAVTAQLTTNVSPVPLLWVVPLGIYLLSFILTFESTRWYRRTPYLALFFLAATGVVSNLAGWYKPDSLFVTVTIYCAALFAATMLLHGELAGLKPEPRHLTRFYLMISVGGAVGGLFTGVLAPLVFDGYWELHIGLVATPMVVLWLGLDRTSGRSPQRRRTVRRLEPALGIVLTGLLAFGLVVAVQGAGAGAVVTERTFFGVLRIVENAPDVPSQHTFMLKHGNTNHGYQFVDPAKAGWPTSYYGERSGAGLALRYHPARRAAMPGTVAPGTRTLRIGVVGLGTGILAAYGREGDYLGFYEIDPAVVRLSDTYFTYLGDARDRGATADVFVGDARLVLERQLAEGRPMGYDVLLLDAFSSDSIPVHLLTREAFDGYVAHLAPGGVIAVHISNRYLDLGPVVRELAEINDREALLIESAADDAAGVTRAIWILVTDNEDFIDAEPVRRAIVPWPSDARDPILWTDDFNNLFSILK